MTGEITLRGRILPVGGIREKVLAAHRAGLKKVLLPERNLKDLVDIPKKVRSDLEIIPVSHMDQVIEIALRPPDRGHSRRKSVVKLVSQELAREKRREREEERQAESEEG